MSLLLGFVTGGFGRVFSADGFKKFMRDLLLLCWDYQRPELLTFQKCPSEISSALLSRISCRVNKSLPIG